MRPALRCLALFAALLPSCAPAQPQRTDADALKLLDRVVKHYQDAATLHVEATVNITSHTTLSDQTQTSTLSATIAPGGRFRYDGVTSRGSALIVSDGTQEWRLLRSFAEYDRQPTGTFFAAMHVLQGDDMPILNAHDLLNNLDYLGANLRTAHFASQQTLIFQGSKVLCAVVHFSSDDLADQRIGWSFETTAWIDEASLTLLKVQTSSRGKFLYGTKTPPYGPEVETVTTTTYTAIQLNFEPQPDTFTFVPPAGSNEVAELPSPFPNNPNSAAKGPTPSETLAAKHLGQPLPPIVLHDAAGNEVSLHQYLGHPLLIDLWATWCAPCLSTLPDLARIRRSTAQTDLKLIAIDEDDNPAIAPQLLKRRGYDWDDFHFNKNVTTQLPTPGIPLMVLVDAQGTILYYHTGVDDLPALTAAIAKLGSSYSAVTLDH